MTKKALLIGINYTGTTSQLQGCINDVLNVQRFLLEHCDFAPENIQLCTDLTELKPTKANLLTLLNSLVAGAQAGDTLLLHYSGHGSRTRDRTGDESDGFDEVLVPLDYASAGMISDDWLWSNTLAQVPKDVLLCAFMDCCHSGTILDLRYNYKSLCTLKKGRLQDNQPYVSTEWTDRFSYALERTRDIPGTIIMLSGALDREYAADAVVQNQPQGAFTACLLETLKRNVRPATQKWVENRLKLRHILKEINCRLDLTGFRSQQCQLSTSRSSLFESFLNL